jgi:hypothetical protein
VLRTVWGAKIGLVVALAGNLVRMIYGRAARTPVATMMRRSAALFSAHYAAIHVVPCGDYVP